MKMGFRFASLISREIRIEHRAQDGLPVSLTAAAGEPPDAPLLDRPVGFHAAQQQGGDLSQGRLVADDQHGAAAVGPARGLEYLRRGSAEAEPGLDFVGQFERVSGLLRALGRTDELS